MWGGERGVWKKKKEEEGKNPEIGSQMKRVSGGRKGSMSKAAKGSGEISADNY